MKTKLKFMLILLAIITLVSTFSFATEVTTEGTSVESNGEAVEINTDDLNANDQTEISEDDWISDDLYEINEKVEVNKIVDGNAFIMASEVVINSEIGGDVFIMAKKITIEENAYIYSSLFAMADEIEINGIVCDAYILANNFTLGDNGYVYRDLRLSANTININGKVRRNAHIVGVNYNFNQENGALIGGDLYYTASQEITLPEDAVMGEVHFEKEVVKEQPVGNKVKDIIFSALNNVVYTLILVLLTLWLAPKFVERVSNMNTGKAIASVGIGILTPFVAIIAAIILLISGIASTAGIALGFILVTICISGTAFASIYFGSIFTKLVKWDGKVKYAISCVVSALIIWGISQIPVIGGIFGLLVASLGIGLLILNIIYKKEVETKE